MMLSKGLSSSTFSRHGMDGLLFRSKDIEATALSLALPAKLEKVALALGLEQQKDRAGHLNMLATSRPRKPRKGEDPSENGRRPIGGDHYPPWRGGRSPR